MEKDVPHKQKLKAGRCSYNTSDKTDFKLRKKNSKRKSLYNCKNINTARGYKNPKYTCTQHWSTHNHKTNITRPTERQRDCKAWRSFILGRSSKQKTNKETSGVNWTLDQMDLKDIYEISEEYILLSLAHETFFR